MKMVLICKPVARRLARVGVVGLVGCATLAQQEVWTQRTTYLMGTELAAVVGSATREEGLTALERVFVEVARLEEVLSSWRDDSEVGRVNAAPPGEGVEVTRELWELLEEARGWREPTGGAFDPAVGALIDAWGLRGEGRRPSADELEAARGATGLRHFRMAPATGRVTRLHPAAWLDTGGFGKGVALRAAREVLRRQGVAAALLDFGGQVLAVGTGPGETAGWEVLVAHPSRRHEPVLRLRVRDASVATTSQSERWVESAGERIGHVLDPRTGQPVPAWGSVTVVAEDPVVADVLSTALFVLGPEVGLEWVRAWEDVGVLFLEERNGELVWRWNRGFERYGPIT